ncbi:hypothetical protein [Variovorax sp. YR216]|uniref:hypothetical protein n=1 Tax=Variovorax sp. YR216 TaxID=1882828 RepID=UPI0008989BAC|nr:hypothetical protein [Variovorax sp. YR216]SEB25738.1 hypothetical protein SAMN05444680_12718 [Variovorax sp. YR216]
MILRFPSTACAIAAAASVLIAGCATQSKKAESEPVTAAAAPAAVPAPAPVAAPVKPEATKVVRKGPQPLTYDDVKKTARSAGSHAAASKRLVGKTVELELAKNNEGGRVPANAYAVPGSDDTYFFCRNAPAGFTGGEVTGKIVKYAYRSDADFIAVDLDRCVPNATQASAPAAAPAPAPAPAPVAAAPAPAPAAAKGGAKPGMDAQGNVIDSSKIEAGSGRTVKGINDFEGEITGNPAKNSKFTQLQIGMSVRQATDIAGPPTDQGAYMTGKAWIPFYFGSDRHRFEMTYKGQGRLIFAGGGMGDFSSGNLIWIIHNPNESGYR